MPKPTSTPRWADVGGDIVEPSAGKKNVGWLADERPPAQYFNWLLNTIYLWCKWIDDGVWTAVSGAFSGAISAASAAISGAITAATGVFSGAVSVVGFTNTGADYHGVRSSVLSLAVAGKAASGTWVRGGGGVYSATAGNVYEIALPFRVGDRIKSWSITFLYDGSTDTYTGRLLRITPTGATTISTNTSTAPGAAGAPYPLTVGETLATPEVVSSGECFILELETNAGTTMPATIAYWTHDRV